MKTEQEKIHDNVILELKELDKETVDFGHGVRLKPSQCYRFEFYPEPHFLFNTNCPDGLKNKLKVIVEKYFKVSQ